MKSRYDQFMFLAQAGIVAQGGDAGQIVDILAVLMDPTVETNINLGDLDQPVAAKVHEFLSWVGGGKRPFWVPAELSF